MKIAKRTLNIGFCDGSNKDGSIRLSCLGSTNLPKMNEGEVFRLFQDISTTNEKECDFEITSSVQTAYRRRLYPFINAESCHSVSDSSLTDCLIKAIRHIFIEIYELKIESDYLSDHLTDTVFINKFDWSLDKFMENNQAVD